MNLSQAESNDYGWV